MGPITLELGAWPKKGARLFTDDGPAEDGATIGWWNPSNQYVFYMMGYKNAADALIDRLLMSKKVEERRTFMFPILFLYRQFIELELKWIFLVYGKANRSERVPLLRTSGHDLIRLWGLIEPVLLKESLAEDRSDVDTVGEYIKQFHELDKTSQRFRYPIAKNLDPMLDKQQQINLPNLRSRMDELYHFFNGVDGKLNSLSEVNEDISEYFDDAAEGLEEI